MHGVGQGNVPSEVSEKYTESYSNELEQDSSRQSFGRDSLLGPTRIRDETDRIVLQSLRDPANAQFCGAGWARWGG